MIVHACASFAWMFICVLIVQEKKNQGGSATTIARQAAEGPSASSSNDDSDSDRARDDATLGNMNVGTFIRSHGYVA